MSRARNRIWGVSLSLALLAFSVPALAGWEVFKTANVKFHVPDTWNTSQEGEKVLTRPPKDAKNSDVFVEFVGIDHGTKDAEKVEESLMKQLNKRFDDVKIVGKGKKIKQHGHDGFVFGGTAKEKSGAEVHWMSAILETGKGTGVAVLAGGTPADIKVHRKALVKTLDSIQANKD